MVRQPFEPLRRATAMHPSALPAAYYFVRYCLLGVVAVAAAAVAYSVFWFAAATQLRDGVSNWVADRQAEGFSANYKRLELSGYPTTLRVLLDQPLFGHRRLVDSFSPEDWQWQGQSLTIEAKPWNFRRLAVLVTGRQNLEFFHELRPLNFIGDLGRFVTDLTMDVDGLPSNLRVGINKLNLATADHQFRIAVGRASFDARRLFMDSLPEKIPTVEFKLSARDIWIPRLWRLPLGYELMYLKLNASVLGEVSSTTLVNAVSSWRNDGGTVEIAEAVVHYGPLRVWTNGTIALDGGLQPVAALTARLQGLFPTVDALRVTDLIRSRDAAMAKVILGALVRRPQDGGPPEISVSLSVQDRTLFAGPVPLMKFPPIMWDQIPPSGRSDIQGRGSMPAWRR